MTSSSFLQSAEWERFQKKLGREAWRIDGALVIEHALPFGFHYLYCPRREAQNIEHETQNKKFFEACREVARREKSIFLKIDPLELLASAPSIDNGRIAHAFQPEKTIILDLTKTEGELLAAMHEKTRYNIRLAERRGVEVKNFQFPISNFQCEIFLDLMQKTAERDRFSLHDREHYEKLLAVRSDVFSNELFFAECGERMLAAAMVNFYHGTATYLHGASASEMRGAMAPYALHWHIMREAQRRGCVSYDLWGVDEKRYPGVTRFKRGFGGEGIAYAPSREIVYRPLVYGAYQLARHIR